MSVGRIDARFRALREAGRKALVGYLTAGDPAPARTPEQMHALVEGGVDLIELGLPFSDPEAEGPSIQAACERALAAGTGLQDCLDALRAFRERDDATPVVLMGYLNMAEWWGYERFAASAAEAGADGCLFVNLPPEEGEALGRALEAHDLAHVFLLAPTTEPERVRRILAATTGFAYYVSLKGTTGADHIDTDEVAGRLDSIRAQSPVPVAVGFGIRTPETAATLAAHADGVVVGSAIVDLIGSQGSAADAGAGALRELAASFRRVLDG